MELTDADLFEECLGQTFARNIGEVRGRVAGYIEKRLVRPGQEVVSGQALYILDLRPLQAQVQQAQGTFDQFEAELESMSPNPERRTQADMQSMQGKILAEWGALQNAKLNLEFGTIQAPIGGVVGETLAEVGALVNPNAAMPLATILPLDPIWVRFTVSAKQLLFLIGTNHAPATETPRMELILADTSVFPHAGEVATTLDRIDPHTGAVELQAEFPNPQHRLHPGQFVRVRYLIGHRTGVILMPRRAIQQSQNATSVFIVGKGNEIQHRDVQTGARAGDGWVIEKGLQAGDRVVLDPLPALRPGMVVQIL